MRLFQPSSPRFEAPVHADTARPTRAARRRAARGALGGLVRLPWAAAACALLAVLAYLVPGCNGDNESNTFTGSSGKGGGAPPALDARGGRSDSELPTGSRTLFEGNGGEGGVIYLQTPANIIATPLPSVVVPPVFDPTLSVNPTLPAIDVPPGGEIQVEGALQVSSLRVQRGGRIVLRDNTFFFVYGDVQIEGEISTIKNRHLVKGRDLTIDCVGIMNITGRIDCSGFWKDGDGSAAADPDGLPGGDGGEIYLSSIPAVGVSDPRTPRIYMGPRSAVLSDGGPTFATQGTGTQAGKGGQILIGCTDDLVIEGRVSAHGGNAYYTTLGFEGDGGTIRIVATGDISLHNVLEVNANGGGSSGQIGGAGGSIIFESNGGMIDAGGFDIECRGGPALYSEASVGGVGGSVTIRGDTVITSDMVVTASGGEARKNDVTTLEIGGVGGQGGSIQVGALTALNLGEDPSVPVTSVNAPLAPVEFIAEGGLTVVSGLSGGNGGEVKLINVGNTGATPSADLFTFEGVVSVRGGGAEAGLFGADGRVCTTGAGLEAAIDIIGANNFPSSACTGADIQSLTTISADLSCDNTPDQPSKIDTTTPAIVGRNFFRVFITDAMKNADPATPYLLITVTGPAGGQPVRLCVGNSSAFGQYSETAYAQCQDTDAGGLASICVDTSGVPVNPSVGFISVMVVGTGNFVQDFSIGVTCSSNDCGATFIP